MTSKTQDGISVRATQRVNTDETVTSKVVDIGPGTSGLRIVVEVGGGKGFNVTITVTPEEITAWLPEIIDQRVRQRVADSEKAMRALAAQEARTLGFTLPYLPGLLEKGR
jgi:hypothetical protein